MQRDHTRLEHLRGIAASLRARLLGVHAEADRARRERDLTAAGSPRSPAPGRRRSRTPTARERLVRQERPLAALDAEARELTARWKTAAMLVERIERHARQRGAEGGVMQNTAAPRRDDRAPPPGRADAADIAALRERIAELRCRARRVAARAAAGARRGGHDRGRGRRPRPNPPPITIASLDTLLRMKPGAVLARLFPEAVARAMAEGVHARYATPGVTPLTQVARTKELARIDDQLRDAEVAEEMLIRLAERRGEAIERRADADPRVLLMEDAE